MIVMDEFPVDIMLGPDGRIDAARYPNFAALAATRHVVQERAHDLRLHHQGDPRRAHRPAAEEGRPTPPTRSHPRTVFDLFGRRGYRIVKSEEATSLCPPRYCRGARPRRPAILPLLQRGRRERLERFFAAVKPGAGFYMKHVLLPHGPYQYLPSGKQTRIGYQDPVPGMNSPPGFGDRFLTQHNQQRLQLQTAYADRQLGNLFKRMVANGSFDQALIVVVADHGFAFEVGVKDRRTVTRRNIDEIAPVPLFVKAPGPAPRAHERHLRAHHRRGADDGRPAQREDALPRRRPLGLLALGDPAPVRADDQAQLHAARSPSPPAGWRRAGDANVRREAAPVRLGRHRARLYTGIGPNRSLLGRTAADLKPAGQGKVRASVSGAANVRAVRASSLLLPTQIAGPVRGGSAGRQARHRRGRERPHRGRRAHLLPARQPAGELRGERARGGDQAGAQHRGGLPGLAREAHAHRPRVGSGAA